MKGNYLEFVRLVRGEIARGGHREGWFGGLEVGWVVVVVVTIHHGVCCYFYCYYKIRVCERYTKAERRVLEIKI